jgi:hypothetical protein
MSHQSKSPQSERLKLVDVDLGYYSRKERLWLELGHYPQLEMTDYQGRRVYALLVLSHLPNPFNGGRELRFDDHRVFFLLERLERGRKVYKLLSAARNREGIGFDTFLEGQLVCGNPDGSFTLSIDESPSVHFEADAGQRLLAWLPRAEVLGVARTGARQRLSPLAA